MLTGPDVSHHQGNVVWSAVRSAGHSFAIVKATEGTGFVDTRFSQNWPGMAAAGLVRGAYHFLRHGNAPAQARHYLNTVGDLAGSIAVLDVERPQTGTPPDIGDVRDFALEYRRHMLGHPLVIYTGRWYWVGVLRDPDGADLGPLWHSEYDGANPFSADVANGPELDNYGGWPGASLWQHTSDGFCPGIAGRCDLNIFYGTADDLHALTGAKQAGGPVPKPPPITEDEDVFYVRVIDDGTGTVGLGGPGYWKHVDDQDELAALQRQRGNPRDVTRADYDQLRAACLHGERCAVDAVG